MIIPLLGALLLSPTAAAAESFSRTELARLSPIVNTGNYFTGGEFIYSSDGRTVAAISSNKVMAAWDTLTGQQKARIEYSEPSVKPDEFDFRVLAVSPDGQSAVLQYQQFRKDGDAIEGKYKLLLADFKQEKIVRTLLSTNYGPARQGGIMTFLPKAESAAFSKDGKTLTADLTSYPPPSHDVRQEHVKLDLDGHRSSIGKGGDDLEDVLDGRRTRLVSDESSCELIDSVTDRRIGFLQDCTRDSWVRFSPEKPRAFSSHDADARLWDTATGKLLFRRNFKEGSESSRYVEVLWAEDARHLLVFNAVTDEKVRFEVWTTAGQKIHSEEYSMESYVGPGSNYWSIGGELLPGNILAHEFRPVKGDASRVQVVVEKLDFGGGGAVAAPAEAGPAHVLDVDTPPQTAAKADPDAYAVVIGVERYRQAGIPAVDFAASDARAMYSYLTTSMGFDPRNVVLLTDDQATKTDLEKNLGSWLKNRVGPQSRVFVYYAGHGSPNPETGQGYLMPYEADPAYLEDTAYPLSKLYASLGKLPTKDVTVVLDACFSGQGQRSLIAKGTRPLVSVAQAKAEPNTVVLAAAGSNQVSASYPEARHGLLTYYLLAGLHGEADTKRDGLITSEELIDYVRPAVERAAKLQNVAQTPSLMAPPGAASRPWIVLPPKK
jgi:hypothetical protein